MMLLTLKEQVLKQLHNRWAKRNLLWLSCKVWRYLVSNVTFRGDHVEHEKCVSEEMVVSIHLSNLDQLKHDIFPTSSRGEKVTSD